MRRSMNPPKFGLWATIALSLLAFACDDSSSTANSEIPSDEASLSGTYVAEIDSKRHVLEFLPNSQAVMTVYSNNCLVSRSECEWSLNSGKLNVSSQRGVHELDYRSYVSDQDSAQTCATPLQSFWDGYSGNTFSNQTPFTWTSQPESFQLVSTSYTIKIDSAGSHMDTTKTVWDFNREP